MGYYSRIVFLILAVALMTKQIIAGTIEVIAVRHGESLNNILSQKKAPISFFISLFQQKEARKETETIFHNPVLSTDGRNQALSLNQKLFPNDSDKFNFFDNKQVKLYVSPLNRTIQTALLIFGKQAFKADVSMVANPNITEHRKSISEDGFLDAARPISLFDSEIKKLLSPNELESPKFQTWMVGFQTSMNSCCDNKKWWPDGPVETSEDLGKRIDKLKEQLKVLPDKSRVVLVSHGTFLRTLFYGVQELTDKNYHLRNTGMLIGEFDQKTGDWVSGSVSCFDPKVGKAASGLDPNAVCFDKLVSPESIVLDKGPVYEIGKSPPWFSSWQNRQLNFLKQDGLVGVTWSEVGSKSTVKVKGAAQIIGPTEECEIPSKWQKDRNTLCFVINRVVIDKELGPIWEKPESDKWEVLRLSWKKTDTKVSEALKLENIFQ